MMMKKTVILALFFAAKVFSQDLQVGIKFGVNHGTLSFSGNNSLVWDIAKRSSSYWGVAANFNINDHWGVNTLVAYDTRAGRFSTLGAADGLAVETQRYRYLTFSPSLQFSVNPGFVFNFGPAFGFKLSAQSEREERDLPDSEVHSYEIENAEAICYRLIVGAGYRLVVARIQFVPEVSYDFGINAITSGGKTKYSGLAFGMSAFF